MAFFWGNRVSDTGAKKDMDKIEALLSRGVENIYPNKEYLKNRLLKGEKLTLYLGIDPTAPTLHLGHAIALKKLKEFQDLGHRIILLVGDFTGMIGDPTDKSATRKRLSRDEVLENARSYKKQASTLISFNGSNSAALKYNSEWLARLNFEDVLNLAAHMTVDQMLKRDMFERRMQEGKPIYIHEFLYPLLQGYDSVAMEVDGEIGGNDQTFNMLAGRTLLKQIKNKEKFVLTMKLLEDATGKKMGKTEGNMVSLSDLPNDMYGKVLSWTDRMIPLGFELCTFLTDGELAQIREKLESGENPKPLKMKLAREIVSIYHGKSAAEKAEENFKKTFEEGSAPENFLIGEMTEGQSLAEVLVSSGATESTSAARRLIDAGAVEIVGGEVIKEYRPRFEKETKLRVGKKRFVKIIPK